ncbi:MAG: DUF5666 domain-containing protein [Gammaproteobacteria bacterium]|nr:DUF5666 domain-containing protein [Gammaproteobacteria bacterium]MDH5513546.1 DUF5666 domain-containing protein [Gammaproteobacteria bacterium]
MRFTNIKFSTVFSALLVSLVVACGDEQLAGGGIGGTGITSGTVTGFGSVFVNGVEFDTSGAARMVDDVASVSNGFDDITVMKQGMVVTVTGTVNPDGVTGTATSVDFDEVIEGPIGTVPVEDADMILKTFDILGTNVIVNRNTTVFVDTDYVSITHDDVIEVSGFFDASGNLVATLVDKEGVLSPGSTVEVHGVVSGFNGIDTFKLGPVTVVYDGITVFDKLPGTVSDGQFVEASGTLTGARMINAARIELEDDALIQAGPVSLEGIVTRFGSTADFMVGGQQVNASAAVFVPVTLAATIDKDSRVEITGTVAGTVLTAAVVEDRGGAVKVGGRVNSVDTQYMTVDVEVVSGEPFVRININTRTQLEDELGGPQPFTLSSLRQGDEVIIEGLSGAGNSVDAKQLKRKVLDKYELKAMTQSATGDNSSGAVTLLGVTFSTNGSTRFEDSNDQTFPNGGDDFYSLVRPGDILEVEDHKPVNGIADEVELK